MCTSITFDVDGKEPTEAMKDKISSLRTYVINTAISSGRTACSGYILCAVYARACARD